MKHSFALLFLLPFVHAVELSVTRLGATVSDLKVQNLAAASGFTTTKDLLYIANVNVGGVDFPVQLDTGSSDLWVGLDGAGTGIKDTTTNFNLTYGTGWAYGLIARGPVEFGGFSIPDQAFLDVTQADNPVFHFGAVGIVGLGFTSLSHIDAHVNSTEKAAWGRSFLYNAFASNTSTPNYIAFALQRSLDPGDIVKGSFTIGEVESDYASVLTTNHISTFPVNAPTRWTILLDGFTVSGTAFSVTTTVKGAPTNKAVVLLDSGSSYSYVPTYVATAIYAKVDGATFSTSLQQWVVPCDAALRVSLTIDGRTFDLHPLDLVQPSLALANQCIGSFLPQTLSVGGGEFDFILGDNVLRAMYTVYDFGDWETSGAMGAPYMQIMSVVNMTEALADFETVRGGNGAISSAGSSDTNPAATTSTDVSGALQKLLSYTPILFALLGLNALILLGFIAGLVFYFCRRGKGAGAKRSRGGAASSRTTERTRDAHLLASVPALTSNAPAASSRSHAYQAVPADNQNEDGPRYDPPGPAPTRALPTPGGAAPAPAPAKAPRSVVPPMPMAPVVARSRPGEPSAPSPHARMSTATSQRPLSSVTSKSEAYTDDGGYGYPTKHDDDDALASAV